MGAVDPQHRAGRHSNHIMPTMRLEQHSVTVDCVRVNEKAAATQVNMTAALVNS